MSNVKKHIVVLFSLLVFSGATFSQDEGRIESSRMFVKSYFRLPNITSNNFYKEVSRGISDAALSLNYDVYKGINLGLGFKHSFFEISQFKIVEDLDAQTHFYGPFLELSYTYNLSSKIFAEPSLQIGNSTMVTTSNPCRTKGEDKHVSQTTYVSPALNFYIRGFDRMAYSFSIGYTFTNASYSPASVCLDSFTSYSEPDFQKNLQHFNVGFGFLVYLGKMDLE